MMFRSLASSSKGNAYMVSDGDTTILLECGLTMPKLKKAAGFAISQCAACFVTHEHKDHSHSALQLIKQGMPVFMTEGTARALELPDAEILEPYEPVQIGWLRVMAFRVWHDARQPVGFLIDDTRTGERLLFAADTRNLDYAPERLTYVAIECNYEEAILARSERMPEALKARIRHTHMEVGDCIKYLHKLDLRGCVCVWLLHLSAGNSNEEGWMRRFRQEFPGLDIRICPE